MGELVNFVDKARKGLSKNPLCEKVADIIIKFFESASEPLLIAVGGPGGTGKSSFSKGLAGALPDSSILRLDDYKRPRQYRQDRDIFGPHPDANEMGLIKNHLSLIKAGVTIDKPLYDPELGYADKTTPFEPDRFTIVDGEVATYEDFEEYIDFSVFIEADLMTQLNTRLTRDIYARGYTREKALATFFGSNMDEFLEFGAHTRTKADIVLNCDRDYSLQLIRKPVH